MSQQQLGPFPVQSGLSSPPLPAMQSFTIHPEQRSQLIQPAAPFLQFPSHPLMNPPRPQLDPNVQRPRTELQDPRPGTSSSNSQPGASSFTKSTLTYAEYKARKASSLARDPRSTASRSYDRSSPISAPNVPLADQRIIPHTRDPRTVSLSGSIAPTRDPRNASLQASAVPTRDPRTASLSGSIVPTRDPRTAPRSASATPAKDSRSDLNKDPRKFAGKIPNAAKPQKETPKVSADPKVKPTKGPHPSKSVEHHKPKSGSKGLTSDKEKSKSKDSYKEKLVDKKKSTGEVYQSPLESLYGVVNTSRTGPGYGLQNFKIPKIKRKTSSRKRTPSPLPVQEDEAKESENDFPISEVPQTESENWYDDIPIPDTFTLDDPEVFPFQREVSSNDNDNEDSIDVPRAETPVVESVAEDVSLQVNESTKLESSVSANENQLLKVGDSTKSVTLVDTQKDENVPMEVDEGNLAQPGTSTSTKRVENDTIAVRDILEKLTKSEISIEDAEKLMERYKKMSSKVRDSSTDVGDSDNEHEEKKKKKKKKVTKKNMIESDSSDDDYLSKPQDENITSKRLSDVEIPKTDVNDTSHSRIPDVTEVEENLSTENNVAEKSNDNEPIITNDHHQAEKLNVQMAEKKKKKRRYRNDVEKLQADLRECFIGPEVLLLMERPTDRMKNNPPKSMAIPSVDSDVPLIKHLNQKKTTPNDELKPAERSNGDWSKTMFDARVNLKRLPVQNVNQKDNYSETSANLQTGGSRPSTSRLSQKKDANENNNYRENPKKDSRPSSPNFNQNPDSNEVTNENHENKDGNFSTRMGISSSIRTDELRASTSNLDHQRKNAGKNDIENNKEYPNTSATTETTATVGTSVSLHTDGSQPTTSTLNQKKKASKDNKNEIGKKKKRSGWQNGVISKSSKKKAEKPPANNETAEVQKETGKTQTITFKQLIEYFWVDQPRTKCFCCNYIGKGIVHHYTMQHPNEEVLISRLSTDQAQKAIEQTQQRMRNREMSFEIIRKFNCRFCTFSLTSAVPQMVLVNFYEHYTTHTGEYRYKCKFCPYRAAVLGTVKNHINKTCKKKPRGNVNDAVIDEMVPIRGNVLFGYICSMCNFIQLNRSNVETHAKKWHKNAEVIEIDMSDYIKEEREKDTESDDEINSVNNIFDTVPIIKEEFYEDLGTEDIIPEKEIVCPVDIKVEESIEVGEEGTAAEMDPLNGIGDVIKEECFDEDVDMVMENVNSVTEEMDTNGKKNFNI